MSEAPSRDAVSTFSLDADHRIIESTVGEFRVGDVVDGSHGLGPTILEAVDAATPETSPQRRAACDGLRGTHWLVIASVASVVPWRARVVVVDVTAAVVADRAVVLEKVIHSVQNVSFALQSVVDAVDLDRPTGARLDEYLAHLRAPAVRLSTTMVQLGAILEAPAPVLRRATVDSIVERVLFSPRLRCRPAFVAAHAREMNVAADVEMLAESVRAMLDSGGAHGAPTLEVDRVDLGTAPLRAHRRPNDERRVKTTATFPRALGHRRRGAGSKSRSAWPRPEQSVLRARRDGDGGSFAGASRVRLAMFLPLLSAD